MKKRFFYSQGLIIIAVEIKGRNKKEMSILLAVDTASSMSSISPETLKRTGAIFSEDLVLLQGIGPGVFVPSAYVDFEDLLSQKVTSAEVAAHQLPEGYDIDGVLGNDILQHYKLTIDYPNGLIPIQ